MSAACSAAEVAQSFATARHGLAADNPDLRSGLPRRLACGEERCGGAEMVAHGDRRGSGRPVIKIDLQHPHVSLHLLAAATWPSEHDKRAEALATFASIALAQVDDVGRERAEQLMQEAFQEAAEQHGSTVDDVGKLPEFPDMRAQMLTSLVEGARQAYLRDLLAPAGGLRRLGQAAGEQAILAQLRASVAVDVRTIGRVLLLTATMAHSDHGNSASLNRSFAVVEAITAGRPGKVTVRTMKTAWKARRAMAPLYAAQRLWVERASLEPDPHLVAQWIFSSEGARLLVGWAKWFRDWGIGYRPTGAASPLLSDCDTVLLDADVASIVPPLLELRPDEMRAASAYKVTSNYSE